MVSIKSSSNFHKCSENLLISRLNLLVMKNLFTLSVIFTLLLLSTPLFSQNFLVQEWMHTTGIPDTIDWSAATTDGSGNIYVTTNTLVDGEKANILTTKYNSSGVVQWEVSYNSTGDDNDYGTAICVDGSGNVYVAASSYISGNNYDYRTIKYNSSGTLQWNVTYNGPGNFYDVPTGIIVDGSGNVYVTGGSYGSSTLSDFCTIKYNSSGTSQWTSRYNYASDQDIAAIIKFSPSGRVIVAGGSANAPASWDFASIKYNQSTGAQLAENRNSASGAGFDEVYAAETDASGNIYLVGRAAVNDEGYNMRTIKIDTSISVVWARNYDHAELNDEAHGIVVDLSDNVYVTGWVTNADGTKSFETLKYNSSGTLQWSNEEHAANSGLDAYALKISNTVDPYFVVAGNVDNGTSLDFMAVIYNTDGDRLWIEQYDGTNRSDDKINFVKADLDGNYYVGGKSYENSTSTNRLIKYNWNSYIIPPDDDMEHPSSYTFFENKGQIIDTDDELREDIKYYTHRHNPSLYFTDDVLSYVWSRLDTTSSDDTLSRIDLSFPGSNGTKEIHRTISQGGDYLNYFLAHCPDGVTNVRSSDRLIITDIYDNVDLEYYFDGAGIKYYLIIKPGYSEQNDPISLFYDGAEEVNVLGGGELEIVGLLGTIKQEIAEAYQIDGSGDLVPLGWDADYVVIDDYEIGFNLGVYDDGLPLIIEMKMGGMLGGGDCDENVIWGTWYGGTGYERLSDVKVGYLHPANRKIYVSGLSRSANFPADLLYINDLNGTLEDIFIQRFNGDDNGGFQKFEPNWGTYIGGTGNDGNSSIKITQFLDNLAFIGDTGSGDLPVTPYLTAYYDDDINIAAHDGMVGMLNVSGTLIWLTFMGGDEGYTILEGIVTTKEYGLLIVGRSQGGTDFPFYNPGGGTPYYTSGKSGCIIELDINQQVIWGTLFGGSDGMSDWLTDVEIDLNRDYIFTGISNSSGVPTTLGSFQPTFSGYQDTYVMKIHPDGAYRTIDWCTYYGGLGHEISYAITNDNDNNIFVVGTVNDYNISPVNAYPRYVDPLCTECFDDHHYSGPNEFDTEGFLFKLDQEGNQLWSSYFGGLHGDVIRDITYYGDYIMITGDVQVESDTFPLLEYEGAYFDDIDENTSTSFVTMFNKNTELVWSTFLGDNAANSGIALTSINTENELYVVGNVGFNVDENDFEPLCDPGDPAYFQDDPLEVFTGFESYKNIDGFIVGFDISGFPSDPVSIFNEQNDLNFIKIYPNPTSDYVFLTSESEINFINLYDLLGNKLQSIKLNRGIKTYTLNLSEFANSGYLIKIETNLGSKSEIIIKE